MACHSLGSPWGGAESGRNGPQPGYRGERGRAGLYSYRLTSPFGQEQMEKTMKEGIKGEDLNILAGSIPYPDEEVQEKVKLAVLNHLYEKYGLVEEDLVSAEVELVPAGPARDVGFDEASSEVMARITGPVLLLLLKLSWRLKNRFIPPWPFS